LQRTKLWRVKRVRIRTIKPEFWTHPVMSRLDDTARLLAIGLLNYADDEGYFYADPRLIRAALRPLDEDSSIVRRCLDVLVRAEWIKLSTEAHETHGLVGVVLNFTKHQRVDRPSPSKIKPYFNSMKARRSLDDRSTEERKGKEQGKERNIEPKPADAGSAGGGVEKSAEAEVKVEAPPKKQRERNPLIDAMVSLDGSDPEKCTKPAFSAAAAALSHIKAVTPDVTPDEIQRRAANYRLHMPGATLSPSALAKHWARCEKDPGQGTLPFGSTPPAPQSSGWRMPTVEDCI
jgi:hypothetical protein